MTGRGVRHFAVGWLAALSFCTASFCAALAAQPVNNNLGGRLRISGASGRVTGNNSAATGETGEPDHAGIPATHSVWFAWRAPEAGTVTFDTEGSSFDTVLAIYTGTSFAGMVEVESDDDSSPDLTSNVYFDAAVGRDYVLAVDSAETETGVFVLNWLMSPPCGGPAAPAGPDPPDGEPQAPLPATLRWNVGAGLRQEVIFGNDDRLDIYQVTNPAILALWTSTAALVDKSDLRDNRNGTFTLPAETFGVSYGLCASERFRDQPNPAFCSAFLVGPDLLATAGHCLESAEDCQEVAFVFGFQMLNAQTPVLTFPAAQVYYCKEIVFHHDDFFGADWALVRLDRKVPDHPPLKIRRSGKIKDGQKVFNIGYPSGLPAKFADGGAVRNNSEPAFFDTNIDGHSGSSGSAIFNADTLEVEGILVRGEAEEFIDQGGCLVSKRCPDNGCYADEITRSTEFDHLVPPNPDQVTYEVFFGRCGDLKLLGETAEKSWQLEGLERDQTYCWQIAARGECGRTAGPVWTFTTGQPAQPYFTRGDVTEDGRLDLADPISILFYLFAGEVLSCATSADADDNGAVEVTDVVRLLNFLFTQGSLPEEPFPACGLDFTPDLLTCGGSRACGGL